MSQTRAISNVRTSRRRLLAGAGLGSAGVASMLLVGCGGEDDDNGSPGGSTGTGGNGEPKRGGRIVAPFTQDTDQLDPHTNSFTALWPVSLAHAGLLEFVPTDNPSELKVGPYLAESYEQADDTTLVFKLRQGAKFHNGREITADDVKFSLDRLRRDDAKFVRRAQFTSVESVDAVDETTVRVTTKYPDALLLKYLAEVWMAVVPPEAEGELGAKAIGAGPFTVKSWEPGVGFEFQRFADFFLPDYPRVDEIRNPVMTDAASRVAALRSGEIDVLTDIPLRDQDPLAGDKNLVVTEYGQQSFQYFRFNVEVEPFNDPRVRRALSMAIDREAIVQTAFLGKGKISGIIPWPVPMALQPSELNYYNRDIAEAKKLLEAAGASDLKLEHLTTTGVGQQQDITAVVLDQLRKDLGIEAENKTLEYNAYLAAVSKKEFSANIHWGLSYGDIDGYLQEFLTTSGRNYGHWGTAELDEKILAQRQILDEEERAAAVGEIQKELADEMFAIGLANWNGATAWRSGLQDTSVHAIPYVPVRWLNRVSRG